MRFIDCETRRRFDLNIIIFGPGVMEIDWILSTAGGKKGRHAVLKECRLDKQAATCFLRVPWHTNVELIHEWLQVIGNVLNLNVADFSGGKASLHLFLKQLLALRGRLLIIFFFTLDAEVSGVFEANIAFNNTISSQL